MRILAKILSIEDVDMLQWGSVDYSMSISKVGQRGAEEVKATERRVFETVIVMSVPFQAEISSVDQAKYYLDLGGKIFVSVPIFSSFKDWWKSDGDDLRKVVEGR